MLSRATLSYLFLAAVCAYGGDQSANSCTGEMSQLMILGTYHMDNPALDTYNLKADDVLSERRQREINEVLDKVERFRPAKIAIEGQYNETYWTSRYSDYLAGKYILGRNEIEQIAFKLAKRLGHSMIYPVDYQMWMDGRVPAEIADPVVKAKPSASEAPAQVEPIPEWVQREHEVFKRSTVLEFLRFINSHEARRPNHASYFDLLLPDSRNAPYGRTDLVTNWYKRNLRIFTNIDRITKFPGDRILLVIGYGHLTILSDFARSSNYFCLVNTEEYLK